LDDPDGPHQQCRASVMRLAGARTQLWRSGSVPEDLRDLWDAARRLLPDWPGFRRLSPGRGQVGALDPGLAEPAEVEQLLREYSYDVSTTDEGGGLHRLTAKRTTEPPPG